ncbi:NAD(P)-dependent alcohol dehydrogenase [Agromyces protaetiae]|uniref:NAD(P)-dependent alcohol dehydrogenase n=1 Tax=Agromyces protaetiae TaxID=2509455 RepID=A0A4P6FGS3_9MICO|nr:NAD(P)-dependent alcohol dehydrogenase [Agromyces protaetiae]QAY73679.1 NAD(P)-dependent alcohol dehydrogenase [Agromyces protaetiae]
MRAAIHRRFGGPDVLTVADIPTPAPRAGEVLIRVHASTVSAADRRSRAKDVPAGLAIPSSLVLGFFRPRRRVLGMDVSGTVVAVGRDVRRFAPGDEVIAMLGSRFGGHAEYVVIDSQAAVTARPRGLSFEDAAALVFGGVTAHAFLDQVDVRRGTRALVNGASGAVGSAVVQLAHALGAHVTAVTSGANRAMVTALGADEIIDYHVDDFTTAGRSYDVIVDCVGNAPVRRVGHLVAPGGAVLLVAGDLRSMIAARRDEKRLGITVVTAPGPYRAEDLGHLVELAEAGVLRPIVDRTYSLDAVADAHRYVDGGRKRGSVVLSMTTTAPEIR